MKRQISWVILSALVSLVTPWHSASAAGLADLAPMKPRISCTALASADIASTVGATVTNVAVSEVAGEKPYCKVTGTIAPKINFEVRLPTRSWTQRFLQTGCGGLCGNLNVRVEKARGCLPVTNGEIVLASTDMGHQGMDMAWGENLQQREDFAHRGVHLTSVAAKALIAAFYGQAPRYSYFSGCSDGGREALIAAQRYPGDYDGIAAGAPALNFTVQNSFYHAWMALSNQASDGKAILHADDMMTLHRAALANCDARDGLRDGQITDPRICRFDPAVTLCKADYQPRQCLSVEQVAAARKLYNGPRDEKGRRLTLGGPQPGSEMEWPGVFVPRQPGSMIMSTLFARDTINNLLWFPNPQPAAALRDFKFTSANYASMEAARQLYNADDPNLSPFAAHGGKLLLWHGWSDQHISPLNSIDYFTKVGTTMGTQKRDAMLRLFLLPAMGHCSGGDGPNDFALLQSLMAWVEGGTAPNQLIAQRATPTADIAPVGPDGPNRLAMATSVPPAASPSPRTRPVYAFPAVARYSGKGSIDEASHFLKAKPLVYTRPFDWVGSSGRSN